MCALISAATDFLTAPILKGYSYVYYTVISIIQQTMRFSLKISLKISYSVNTQLYRDAVGIYRDNDVGK